MSPPIPSFPNASIAWTGEASGKFSVRSAYKLSLGKTSGEEDPVWKAVNRYADISHVLRTCPNAISVWYSLIRHDQMQRFLSMSIREWILENLRSPEKFSTAASWELLFGAVLWNIWLARNAVVFDSSSCLSNPIIQSSRVLVERTLQAYGDVRGNVRAGRTIAATIKWSPPEEGWYKLNTDGATRKQDVHVLRRANSVADRLAKLAIPGSNCVTYLANPPPSIVPILQGDIASHLVSYDPLYVS
ncbi:hypothetical protein V6N13_117221 [Hibiscus sabdariffa]